MTNSNIAPEPSVEEAVFSLIAHVVQVDTWALAARALEAPPTIAACHATLGLPVRDGAEPVGTAWFGRDGGPFLTTEREALRRLLDLATPWLCGPEGTQPYALCVLREAKVVASWLLGGADDGPADALAVAAAGQTRLGPVPFAFVRTLTFDGDAQVLVIERLAGVGALGPAVRRYGLSPRELDVLRLLLTGASTPDIADQLAIGGETVRDHVKNLLRKTGARNRVELAGRALGYEAESNACPSS